MSNTARMNAKWQNEKAQQEVARITKMIAEDESNQAHHRWVLAVEALPAGDLRDQEEAWGLRQVHLSAEYGGGNRPAAEYEERIKRLTA